MMASRSHATPTDPIESSVSWVASLSLAGKLLTVRMAPHLHPRIVVRDGHGVGQNVRHDDVGPMLAAIPRRCVGHLNGAVLMPVVARDEEMREVHRVLCMRRGDGGEEEGIGNQHEREPCVSWTRCKADQRRRRLGVQSECELRGEFYKPKYHNVMLKFVACAQVRCVGCGWGVKGRERELPAKRALNSRSRSFCPGLSLSCLAFPHSITSSMVSEVRSQMSATEFND